MWNDVQVPMILMPNGINRCWNDQEAEKQNETTVYLF